MTPEDRRQLLDRGRSLLQAERFAEAGSLFEDMLRGAPGDAMACVGLSIAVEGSGDPARALALLDRAIAVDPAARPAYARRMMIHFAQGRIEDGFRDLHFARMAKPWPGAVALTRRNLAALGPSDAVLMRGDWGLGDSIQFVRYAGLVAQTGAAATVELHPDLIRICESLPFAVELVPEPAAPSRRFSHCCALTDLPYLFGLGAASAADGKPYLVTAERSRRRIDEPGGDRRPRIGLCWASGGAPPYQLDRSVSLTDLAPLLERPARFLSLQKGMTPNDPRIDGTAMAGSRDFADTAAIIGGLDLVISVDTSIAHLAGALGKPVWLLLPTNYDWRWMADRADSPWYPAHRLFRQVRPRDWTAVIARLAAELDRVVAGDGRPLRP